MTAVVVALLMHCRSPFRHEKAYGCGCQDRFDSDDRLDDNRLDAQCNSLLAVGGVGYHAEGLAANGVAAEASAWDDADGF